MLIEYRLSLADGRTAVFPLRFDDDTMRLQPPAEEGESGGEMPPWTRLEVEQCRHCPLRAEPTPVCPLAQALVPLVRFVGAIESHALMTVTVVCEERELRKLTTAQRAAGSLMGLLAATSGCPHTAYLRPMARFHLPLASEAETVYRATSMYLLAQYFRHRQGMPADLDLGGLKDLYRKLHELNQAMARRLRLAGGADASVNGMVLLDCFAHAMPVEVDDALPDLASLFAPYLEPVPGPER